MDCTPCIFLTGGYAMSDTGIYVADTTELVSPGQETIFGAVMPIINCAHCIVKYAAEQYILLGGFNGVGVFLSSTYTYNKVSNQWTNGLSMASARHWMVCGSMTSLVHQGRTIIVVAGGKNTYGIEPLQSTEILDIGGSDSAEWIYGSKIIVSLTVISNCS
jgi:hypothetical protein